MASKITLWDMARKGGNNCWSPNVWKTRLVLNYKGLDYDTIWLTHPEIAPTLEKQGFPPNLPTPNGPPNTSPYTLPALRLPTPDNTHIMDSLAIATLLDHHHPTPSLHLLTNNLHNTLTPLLAKITVPLIPVFMPRIGRSIIPETAQPYFHSTRSQRFGMPLAQLEREQGGDAAWAAARPGIEELAVWVRGQKVDAGPFVLGSQVCYADFVIVGLMESLRRIGADLFEGFVGGSVELREMHAACGRWMERDT